MSIGILENKLINFVTEILSDRDESHGIVHAYRVKNFASDIYIAEYMRNIIGIENYSKSSEEIMREKNIIDIIAMLHDVADHKYDIDGKNQLKMRKFLQLLVDEKYIEDGDINKIIATIERISFSREKKYGDNDWQEKLGDEWIYIRNIVSDADKLDALGKKGLERCIEYSRSIINVEDGDKVEDKVKENVMQHADDKLLLLKDKYIRTFEGKKLAEKLHDELVDELEKYIATD